jgi:hypothetical protein
MPANDLFLISQLTLARKVEKSCGTIELEACVNGIKKMSLINVKQETSVASKARLAVPLH